MHKFKFRSCGNSCGAQATVDSTADRLRGDMQQSQRESKQHRETYATSNGISLKRYEDAEGAHGTARLAPGGVIASACPCSTSPKLARCSFV